MSSRFASAASVKLGKLLSPVTKTEARQAIKTVEATLKKAASKDGPSFAILWAALSMEGASKRGEKPRRLIEVVAVDYAGRRNLRYLIDAKGNVAEVGDLLYRPPFSDEEMREARTIAESDARVARIAKVRKSFVSEFGPDDDGSRGARLVGLRYAAPVKGGFELLARVVVDVSSGRLVSMETGEGEGRKGRGTLR